MKNLLLILTIVLTLFTTSCSKKGIVLTSKDVKSDNYWHNQYNKIVHRNKKYAKMEKRFALKEKKSIDRIVKFSAKKVEHSKRLAQTKPFDFH